MKYDEWKPLFGITFEDAREDELRYKLFKKTDAMIALGSRATRSAFFEHNEHSALTNEERHVRKGHLILADPDKYKTRTLPKTRGAIEEEQQAPLSQPQSASAPFPASAAPAAGHRLLLQANNLGTQVDWTGARLRPTARRCIRALRWRKSCQWDEKPNADKSTTAVVLPSHPPPQNSWPPW